MNEQKDLQSTISTPVPQTKGYSRIKTFVCADPLKNSAKFDKEINDFIATFDQRTKILKATITLNVNGMLVMIVSYWENVETDEEVISFGYKNTASKEKVDGRTN